MSHKNYFKSFNNKIEDEKNVVEESEVVKEEIQESAEDTETIESVESDEQIEENTKEPTEATESVEAVLEKTIGYVDGCDKLNVRKDPSKDSEIVCVIENSTELVIDLDQSTDDFYRITTLAGVDGYCMKKFVMVPKSSE